MYLVLFTVFNFALRCMVCMSSKSFTIMSGQRRKFYMQRTTRLFRYYIVFNQYIYLPLQGVFSQHIYPYRAVLLFSHYTYLTLQGVFSQYTYLTLQGVFSQYTYLNLQGVFSQHTYLNLQGVFSQYTYLTPTGSVQSIYISTPYRKCLVNIHI